MTTKAKISTVSALTVAAFAVGRYTTPVKVVTETKTVTVESKSVQSDTEKDKNVHTDTVVTVYESKGGSKKTITHTVQDTQSVQEKVVKAVTQVASEYESREEVDKELGGRVTIQALAGTSIHDISTSVYGGAISKEIFGPVSAGVWGLSTGVVGVSLGVTF